MGQITKLFRFEQASGLLMIAAIALAMGAANSPLEPIYAIVHHTPVHFRFGLLIIDKPLVNWINEGLMVIFFLLVGLEIKRQILEGHLSTPKCAALPAFAALGGMLVPAGIYVGLNWSNPIALRGWAIPTATDIVLVLGVLSVLGSRVPVSLKIFLTALAIFDDIGAVLIVSIFYGGELEPMPFMIAFFAVSGLAMVNKFRFTRPAVYVALGTVLWMSMLKSGLEAALAGFLVAMAVPLRTPGCHGLSPLRKTERHLHAWNVLLIVPLFAFFNAGVSIQLPQDPWPLASVPMGVIAGLCVGKPVGIFCASRAAVALGLAQLPQGTTWPQLYGAGVLAGVGFTISTLITTLAFTDVALASLAKLAVLVGSFLSAVAGLAVVGLTGRDREFGHFPND